MKRFQIDRRSGGDKRRSYRLDYFTRGGEARRRQIERRKSGERRSRWVRGSHWRNVYPAPGSLILDECG